MLEKSVPSGYLRLAHTADLHIGSANFGPIDRATGLHGRVLDTLACLDKEIDIALEKGCELFIISGDLFPNDRPDPTLNRELLKRIKRISEAGLSIVVVPGNHDISAGEGRASAATTLQFLAMPRVHVLENFGATVLEGLSRPLAILHIPWILPHRVFLREEVGAWTDSKLEEKMQQWLREQVRDALKELPSDIAVVVVAHVIFGSVTLGSEQGMTRGRSWSVPADAFTDERIRYVALGHMHEFQQVGFHPPAVYPGTPDIVDFSEEGHKKGFVIADLPPAGEAVFEFVPLPAREYKTIKVDVSQQETPLTYILKTIAHTDIKDKVVRLKIVCRPDQSAGLREADMHRALSGAYAVGRTAKRLLEEEGSIQSNDFTQDLDPLRALDIYFKQKQLPAARVEALVNLARELTRDMKTEARSKDQA